jgi:hypothetical protein
MGAMLMKRRKMMVRLRKWKHKRMMIIYDNEVRDELLIIGKQRQQHDDSGRLSTERSYIPLQTCLS